MPEGGKLGLKGKIGLKVPCPRLDDCGFDPATGERFCRTLNTAELADWVPRPTFEAILVRRRSLMRCISCAPASNSGRQTLCRSEFANWKRLTDGAVSS